MSYRADFIDGIVESGVHAALYENYAYLDSAMKICLTLQDIAIELKLAVQMYMWQVFSSWMLVLLMR